MMMPPMRRVLAPQLVVAQYLRCPSASRYCISKLLAKFVPRLWLLAASQGLPSPLTASTAHARHAPPPLSFLPFRPHHTRTAAACAAKAVARSTPQRGAL